MATVNQLRKHVFDDALELAAATGMLAPLVEVSLTDDEMPGDINPVLFIRRQLLLQVTLALTRMYDKPQEGRTGTTASIEALLDAAESEGRLTAQLSSSFREQRERLLRDYHRNGGNIEELRRFRHSELAHSLQRHSDPEEPLLLLPLWDFAHETFELVSAMEQYLDQSGVDMMFLANRFELWRDQGIAFWRATGVLKE